MKRIDILKVAIALVSGLILMALPLFGACTAAPSSTPTPAPTTEKVQLKMFYLMDLTGPYAGNFQPISRGTLAFMKWANETELIPGVEILYEIYDQESDALKAIAAFKKAMATKPRPVVGMASASHINLAIKGLVEQERIPFIEATTHSGVETRGSWIFSAQPRYCGQAAAACNYFIENIWKGQGKPKFAHITWDNAFGRMLVTDEFIDYITSKGWEYMGAVYVPPAASDTMALALQLKDWGIDFGYGGIYPSDYKTIIKDCDRVGMTGKFLWGAGSWCSGEDMVKFIGPLANGSVWTHHYLTRDEWPPEMQESFVESGLGPESILYWSYAWGTMHNTVEALRRAVEAVGAKNVTGEDVYKAVQTINGFTGHFYCPQDFTYDLVGGHSVRMFQIQNEELVPLIKQCTYVPDLWPGGKDVVK